MSGTALTGGRVNYYLATVLFPQREDQPAYTAECEDIIAALKMDFNEACEFKAIWRTAAARLGNGKPGQKALYDAEKRLHYAGRSVRELRLAEKQDEAVPTSEDGWYEHNGNLKPDDLADAAIIVVTLKNGRVTTPRRAHELLWTQEDDGYAIAKWRYHVR